MQVGLPADLTAYVMQRSARRTARYGDDLYFAGTDLPEPETITVPTRHGAVRCEVYRPYSADGSTRLPPAYAHLHGGAFVMRFPRMDDFFARFVAAEAGAVVVNVDYDVAPQHRFPVAQHQAHDVLGWIAEHGAEIGCDGERVAVGGFSAGGNLAASACLQARDSGTCRPRLQVLGVPSLDVAEPSTAKRSTHPHPMITTRLLELVRAVYFTDEAARATPYASPLCAADLAGLPPAVVITGEHDVLRAEGDAYAERLAAAGVEVVHRVVSGADHYFLDGDRTRARSLLDLIATELRRRLAAVEPAGERETLDR
ncbi:MAG: alpha/beta hydrolase [Actinomycetes bacterium]